MNPKALLKRIFGGSDRHQPFNSTPLSPPPKNEMVPVSYRTAWERIPAINAQRFSVPTVQQNVEPQSLGEFIGQERAIERLSLAMGCADLENRPLDPVLILGPSGSGKTTLAKLVARAQNSRPVLYRAASAYRVDDLRADLQSVASGRVYRPILILDELHTAAGKLRDTLLVVMDQIAGHRGDKINPGLTLCGLTNRSIPAPLRRRFPIQIQLVFPTVEELTQVVESFARQTGVECQPEAARLLAGVAFTPGKARILFVEARNRAVALDRPLNSQVVLETLCAIGIDPRTGLDEIQLAALRYLCAAKRASRHALRTVLAIDDDEAYGELEDTLVRLGYITVTSRGREPTERAIQIVEGRQRGCQGHPQQR
jgi:Holliday junction DNA helicase RuvB